jgi:hypothetical protein
MHQYAITTMPNGFGVGPPAPTRTQGAMQAEANNLDTNMANFRVGVQAFKHPMQSTLLGMTDLAIAEARTAQGSFSYANKTAWTADVEHDVERALNRARQHYSAAAAMSASIGGPQAQGVWLPTGAPTPALMAEPGAGRGTLVLVAAAAGVLLLVGMRKRRKRR